MFIVADDVHAAVGGATVYDDVLNARLVLIEHRQNGLLDELGLVV